MSEGRFGGYEGVRGGEDGNMVKGRGMVEWHDVRLLIVWSFRRYSRTCVWTFDFTLIHITYKKQEQFGISILVKAY